MCGKWSGLERRSREITYGRGVTIAFTLLDWQQAHEQVTKLLYHDCMFDKFHPQPSHSSFNVSIGKYLSTNLHFAAIGASYHGKGHWSVQNNSWWNRNPSITIDDMGKEASTENPVFARDPNRLRRTGF